MPAAVLQTLADAVERLSRAVDGGEVREIEQAVAQLRPILDDVRSRGGWHINEETSALLKSVAAMLDDSRIRAKVRGDVVRRRLDMLADRGVATGPATYGRQSG